MKSVYAKIVAWSVITMIVSMGLFFIISRQLDLHLGAEDFFRRVQILELEQTTRAYQAGGPLAAAELVKTLDRTMGWRHYVLDSASREIATGVDRKALVARLNGHWNQPVPITAGVLFGTRLPGVPDVMIVEAHTSFTPWIIVLFDGLILLTVAVLCWPLAFHIGSPLRSLARTVERFGQGDLSIRVRARRRDEIGELSRSFDRMADRLETLLTAERRLLQDVSHELRSPLARLSFATELVATEPDREKAVQRIRKEVSRLAALVGSLIEMTRAEGDPAASQRRAFSISQLVGELADDAAFEAAARGVRIAVVNSGDVAFTGDPELIRRAIENVLRNAIQYSPEGGLIEIKVESAAGSAHIRIADQGPGVSEAEIARIFDPFYRVDNSRSGFTGGMGLGLSIAQRAVRLHHGEIDARNLHPGLLVAIHLPIA